MRKFNPGDSVRYDKGDGTYVDGKVLSSSTHYRGVGHVYRVKWNNSNLIPPLMDIEEKHLTKVYTSPPTIEGLMDNAYGDNIVDAKTHCPKCGKLWHVSKFHMNTWYDCIECEIKREDYVKD